jgi:hypothetical protein
MSGSDPFADIVAAPQANDPFADIVQPRRRVTRGGIIGNIPGMGIAMDVARGFTGAVPDIAGLAGYLSGSEGLTDWSKRANAFLDENIASRAEFKDDPVRALIQTAGPALVPLGGPVATTASTANRIVRMLPTGLQQTPGVAGTIGGVVRAGEIALPGSAPYNAGNIALNAGAGAALSYGAEKLGDAAEEAKLARINPPRTTSAVAPAPPADPLADIIPPGQKSWYETAQDTLPWVVGGLAVLSVGAAMRYQSRFAQKQLDAANPTSLTQPGTPDAMQPMTGVIEGIENGLFNQYTVLNNRIDERVRNGTISRQDGDSIIGTVITHANEAVNSDVLREVWDTGLFPGGTKTVPPSEVAYRASLLRGANVDAVTKRDDFTRFNNMLAAMDELDLRKSNLNNTKTVRDPVTGHYKQVASPVWRTDPLTGKQVKGEPRRSALSDIDDATLRQRVAEGMRAPEVVKVVDEYRQINNALLDYGHKMGIWSAKEVADMRAKNPNYMHRMIADLVLERNQRAGLSPIVSAMEGNSPLTNRNRAENAGPDRYQDAMMNMQDGIGQTLDFIRRNEALKSVANNLSSTFPSGGAKPVSGIGRVLVDRPGLQVDKGYIPVPFRDHNGTRFILELDPTISQGLLPYPRAFVPIANGARMLEQKLTTGPIGFLLGNLQAPASMAMGAVAALISAPSNMRIGILDKWIQNSTGISPRKLGIFDPTFFAQVLVAPLRDLWDLRGQVLGGALQRSLDKNGFIANQLGPVRAQAMADAFKRSYEASDLHRMKSEGLIAQGLSYAMEGQGLTGFAAQMRNLAQNNPEYAKVMNYGGFAPDIRTAFKSFEQFREYTAVKGARMTPIALRKVWQGYSKFLDLVANAPQSAMYRANKGSNERGVIGYARSVTGDPSQFGNYRIVQGILSMVPYGNIMVQGAHQPVKAFKREPASFAARTAMFATMASVAMLQSAVDADERAVAEGKPPKSVAHLLTRDGRDAASAFRFYWNSDDPESSIRVPIEQSFAPFFSAVLGSIQAGFDVDNPDFFTERYAPLRDSLSRLIEDGNDQRMRASFGLAGGDVPMLGAVDAASRMITGSTVENAMAFATGPRIAPDRSARSLDRMMMNNDVSDRYTATVLQTALGYGGEALLDLWRTFGIVQRTEGTAAAAKATLGQYGANITGGARIVGPAMFGQERRLRSNDVVGETILAMEQKLDSITRNMGQIRGGEGTIGPSSRLREPEFGGGRAGVPEDMQPVLLQLGQFNSQISKIQQQRKDKLEELRTLSSSPILRANPSELRTKTNQVAQEVREINAQIYQAMLSVEADISDDTGRRVRIADLDPMKGLDQFPRIHR